MSDKKFFHINHTGKLMQIDSLEAALAAVKKSGYIWLDYCAPQKVDLEVLVEPLGLHPLAVEDCFDDNQIPKMEDYPKNTFILFNAFQYQQHSFAIHEVDAILGSNYLVTVSGMDAVGQPVLNGIAHSVEKDLENVRQGPAYLLHVILDQIVDQKFVAIEAMEEEINAVEDIILSDMDEFDPAALLHLRRDLLNLRKSLFHEREILVKINRKDSLFIPDKAILYYRDIYDHLAKFFELTESSRDVVTSLMEMQLSMLNNRMTRAANDTNLVVRRLTFITTIFMPLSLLAGIGGMSEWSMMTGPENWRVSYPAFLLGMVLIGIVNYYLLKWIERKSEPKDH
jgi:magnesium transporter